MKINKTKTTYAGGADAPTEKEILKAVKGEKFADALAALESAAANDAAAGATQTALTEIAVKYDLSDEQSRQSAIEDSAEFLVKSRLKEEFRKSEKTVKELTGFVSEDAFLKSKLLSILQKLSDKQR